jgi:hypothetical protein
MQTIGIKNNTKREIIISLAHVTHVEVYAQNAIIYMNGGQSINTSESEGRTVADMMEGRELDVRVLHNPTIDKF